MLALPGAASIYQGEELGLPKVLDLPDDALTDPIFRRTGSRQYVRDGCRFWHLYRDALSLRNRLPQLSESALRWLETPSEVLAFVRGNGLVVAVNFGDNPVHRARPRPAVAEQRVLPARDSAR